MSLTFDDIEYATGFASGDKWQSPDEVRQYFQREVLTDLVGYGGEDDIPDQETLDVMASTVIDNRWHCTF